MSEKNLHSEESVNKPETKRRLTAEEISRWGILVSAHKGRSILKGTIASVEYINGEITAVLYVEDYRIIIPFAEFFAKEPVDMTDLEKEYTPDGIPVLDENGNYKLTARGRKELTLRRNQMLSKCLGLEVEFIIIDLVKGDTPAECAIVASRIEALRIREVTGFGDGKEKAANFAVGDEVNATILSVGPHLIYVTVSGVDAKIPLYKLTYRYKEDLIGEYKPGEKLRVVIESIKRDEDGRIKTLDVNAKMCEKKTYEKNFYRARLKANCTAIITGIHLTEKGTVYMVLYLDGLDLPAKSYVTHINNLKHPPVIGDKVLFTITYINEEKKSISGKIIKYMN